jgi:molybdate transport system ATP-binding protein
VFQEPSLLSHLSVRGNLDYALKRNGGVTVDAERIITLLRLEALLPRRVNTLSGGERQRVALARALFSAPDILLMDEPLSSLDAEAKAEIIPLIAEISRQSAIPILYVSHDGFEVERLADRTLRLSKGRLIEAPETKPVDLEGLSEADIRALAEAALRAGLKV